jgi:hypothetical protein
MPTAYFIPARKLGHAPSIWFCLITPSTTWASPLETRVRSHTALLLAIDLDMEARVPLVQTRAAALTF